MDNKPIFCVTHPRSCSTAFERIFMTRDDLICLHEPFADAFHYGPERMSSRYETDEARREASGFAATTYADVFRRFEEDGSDGKRIFLKDMAYYLMPPEDGTPELAPSLLSGEHGETSKVDHTSKTSPPSSRSKAPIPYGTSSEPGNPTIVPIELLRRFQYTFLIRDPHYSIPSYYRCTIPPQNEVTGFDGFYPSEAGYNEMRRFLDYTIAAGLAELISDTEVEQHDSGGDTDGAGATLKTCVVDADDLLEHPDQIIPAYCQVVGLRYYPEMLSWGDEKDLQKARQAFQNWDGWHDDILNSTELRPRPRKEKKSEEEFDREWTQKYGEEGARIIRRCVDDNMDSYLYLRRFALRVNSEDSV